MFRAAAYSYIIFCGLFFFVATSTTAPPSGRKELTSIEVMNQSYKNYEHDIKQNILEDTIVDAILIIENPSSSSEMTDEALQKLSHASRSGSSMATFLLCREESSKLNLLMLTAASYPHNNVVAPSSESLESLNFLFELLKTQLENNSLFPVKKDYPTPFSSLYQFKRPSLPSLGIYAQAYNLHFRTLAFSLDRNEWFQRQQQEQQSQLRQKPQQQSQKRFSPRSLPLSENRIPSFYSPPTTAINVSDIDFKSSDTEYLSIDKDLIGNQMRLEEERRRSLIVRDAPRDRSHSDDHSERRKAYQGGGFFTTKSTKSVNFAGILPRTSFNF